MLITDDMQLLAEYAANDSEQAFAVLVSRYINLVYSAALRHVGNPSEAEEITQATFIVLAKKAGSFRQGTVLSGWLYQTARLTAANFLRTERRRQHREQEAHMQSILNEPEPDLWAKVGPMLDNAMAALNQTDRNAVVLRYFEGKPLKEVGAALGTNEDAAKMRVNRAVDKLRNYFARNGVTLSATALGALITAHSVQAAPIGLSSSIVAAACKGSALAASTLTLVKGTLNMIAWTKIQIAIGLGAAAIVAVQWTQIATQNQDIATLGTQLQETSQKFDRQQAATKKMEDRNQRLAKEMRTMARDESKMVARKNKIHPDATPTSTSPDMRGMLAKMLKDPASLKMMRDQQEMLLKTQYATLLKQLNLSPDASDKFYSLLLDNQMTNMVIGSAVLEGSTKETQGSLYNDNKKELDNQLQALLGDSGYAEYQQFKDEIPDRMMLDRLKVDFADNPLTDDQQQHLLQAMKDADKNVPAIDIGPAPFAVSNPMANMDQQMQRQETVNQAVLQEAANFLTPDQVQTLGTSQTNFLNLEKMGMTMARQMFSKNSNATPADVSSQ